MSLTVKEQKAFGRPGGGYATTVRTHTGISPVSRFATARPKPVAPRSAGKRVSSIDDPATRLQERTIT